MSLAVKKQDNADSGAPVDKKTGGHIIIITEKFESEPRMKFPNLAGNFLKSRRGAFYAGIALIAGKKTAAKA